METFDNAEFRVDGDCLFTAIKNCNPDGPQFEVDIQGEKFSKDSNTSWVQAVAIKVFDRVS